MSASRMRALASRVVWSPGRIPAPTIVSEPTRRSGSATTGYLILTRMAKVSAPGASLLDLFLDLLRGAVEDHVLLVIAETEVRHDAVRILEELALEGFVGRDLLDEIHDLGHASLPSSGRSNLRPTGSRVKVGEGHAAGAWPGTVYTSAVTVCRTCGHRNPQAAHSCAACGSALDADGRSREERKVVTTLFCDLVEFTSRFDLADPEDVQDTLATYHARVRREIERFGGTVEKFIGDAVMAVYGAPVAHEDDAQRAVFSALRIPPVIEELNETNHDLPLAVRIGIETGVAVVSVGAETSEQGIAIGDVVNTASRLQGWLRSEASWWARARIGSRGTCSTTSRSTRCRSRGRPRRCPSGSRRPRAAGSAPSSNAGRRPRSWAARTSSSS